MFIHDSDFTVPVADGVVTISNSNYVGNSIGYPSQYSYYPVYYPVADNKHEKALKVAKALMANGTVKLNTAKQLIDLIDTIIEAL